MAIISLGRRESVSVSKSIVPGKSNHTPVEGQAAENICSAQVDLDGFQIKRTESWSSGEGEWVWGELGSSRKGGWA